MSSLAPSAETTGLRRLLSRFGGRGRWEELERLAGSPEFGAFIAQRHPSLGPMLAGPGRRRLLQVMAASFAFGGLAGSGHAQSSGYSEIVPYVDQPTGLTPTEPQFYASAVLLDGIANGVLVTTIDGRPIKIEGNAEHPWSRGGTDIFAQASVLDFYDPDRSQAVQHLGSPTDWESFRGAMYGRFAALRATKGRGLRLLTGPVSSPSLIAEIQRMQREFPEMHWHAHAPVGRDCIYDGARQAFGKPLETRWAFDKADLIVSLAGDFLDPGPQQVGAARAWSAARHAAAGAGRLLAMHALAPFPTLTSAKADHHQPVSSHDLQAVAEALLADVTGNGGSETGALAEWRRAIAPALRDARGRSIVLTGSYQSPALHAAVHRLNAALGNIGSTVIHTDPVLAAAEPFADLLQAMRGGDVEILVMLDANPVYTAPGDAEFAEALTQVPLKLHAGRHVDETALRSDWHLPLAHPLESWGDARSLDGTVTMIQPAMLPLYNGRPATEILSLLHDPDPRSGHDILRRFWRDRLPGADFESAWRKAVQAGFVAGSAFPAQNVTPAAAPGATPKPPAGGLDVLIRPDPTIWDGQFANNAWLQELPKPWTKTVWENVVTISPALAAREKLRNGDMAVVQAGQDRIYGPVWIVAGQHDDTIMVQLGYGRSQVGSVGERIGYDATPLRRQDALWMRTAATLARADGGHRVVTAQQLEQTEGHDYVRRQPVGGAPVGDDSAFTQPTLYNRTAAQKGDGRAWGMVIDLDSCIGCNACVVACQAENNVPVVGREEFAAGRDMHWLRVDHYASGPQANPDRAFMPVPCMHCETAPCELGCPVEATVHDSEGLNLMVYNRCVGTRACSSYCPYKVRHFNFLHYSDAPPPIQAQRNPSVTVRARGVMEKCTYCVQRIWKGRIAADKQHRPIRDGEVVTACAAACPTSAIVFGDLADSGSAVAAARKDGRNYALLGELNTRPRTTYLAALAPKPEKA